MSEEIGKIIRKRREALNLSQDELIKLAGFDWERQTLGQIENGSREIKAWELAKVSGALKGSLIDFFPNSGNQSTEEKRVLWREKPANHLIAEAEFLRLCKDYKLVEEFNKVDSTKFSELAKVEIDFNKFSYSDAYSLADKFRSELSLGDFPTSTLVKTLEERFGVKFFFNDLDGNGSAATSVSELGNCILVSSKEPPWRQFFSIAHELFHIVTWSQGLVDQVLSSKELWDKNEKFANAFAQGLLIPSDTLNRELARVVVDNKIGNAELVGLATQFGVSVEALLFRMRFLGKFTQETVDILLKSRELKSISYASRPVDKQSENLLSVRFVRLAYIAFEKGEITKSRLSKMLNSTLSGLSKTLEKYGLFEVGNNEIALNNP